MNEAMSGILPHGSDGIPSLHVRGCDVKVCLESGCPTLTNASRCPVHARAKDRARGTRQARGYGKHHERLRADYQRRMDAGEQFICWRCAEQGKPHHVDPFDWHLGHDDLDRSVYRGPECPPGNLATAGRWD